MWQRVLQTSFLSFADPPTSGLQQGETCHFHSLLSSCILQHEDILGALLAFGISKTRILYHTSHSWGICCTHTNNNPSMASQDTRSSYMPNSSILSNLNTVQFICYIVIHRVSVKPCSFAYNHYFSSLDTPSRHTKAFEYPRYPSHPHLQYCNANACNPHHQKKVCTHSRKE